MHEFDLLLIMWNPVIIKYASSGPNLNYHVYTPYCVGVGHPGLGYIEILI